MTKSCGFLCGRFMNRPYERRCCLRNNWNQVQSWDVDSLYSGQILEITTPIPENGTMQMLVNGESIPVLYTEGNTQTFGFIMPEADVEIQIRIVTEEQPSD